MTFMDKGVDSITNNQGDRDVEEVVGGYLIELLSAGLGVAVLVLEIETGDGIRLLGDGVFP